MIEYNDLNEIEKGVINGFIKNVPQNIRMASNIWFDETEIEELAGNRNITERVVSFLCDNDFIKLRTYKPSYDFMDEGKKLLKYGSIEKYYEKQNGQSNSTMVHVVGHGNVITNAGGNAHLYNITVSVNQNEYDDLNKWGVEQKQIDELKEMIATKTQDKPTFVRKALKWLSSVSASVASKQLTDNMPMIEDFVHRLIS